MSGIARFRVRVLFLCGAGAERERGECLGCGFLLGVCVGCLTRETMIYRRIDMDEALSWTINAIEILAVLWKGLDMALDVWDMED